jgi:predicted P-type ATPase
MLTGESVPVTKTGLTYSDTNLAESESEPAISSMQKFRHVQVNDDHLSIKDHRKHILFCGTQIIQTRYYANEKIKAVVLRTGFNTTKGELIRSILYPKPVEYRFNLDMYKYVGALAGISVLGMIFSIVLKTYRNDTIAEIIIESLDLVAIVVPPVLPGALTACLLHAQNRLKKHKIYCISPNVINVCGNLNTFVFDKTGTLTEDDSDLKFILPATTFRNESKFENKISRPIELISGQYDRLMELMASCHSIIRVNGQLSGDPLDLKMFDFVNFEFYESTRNENENYDNLMPTRVYPRNRRASLVAKSSDELQDIASNPYEIGIIKQFPFSSSLQRMGVIVRALNRKHFDFFCKGSPEMIAGMCRPESIPTEFEKTLFAYTTKGYRVIGLAAKQLESSFLKVKKIDRSLLEKDLDFLGLLVMENKLKIETYDAIRCLNVANIRSIMCTGDNVMTAISVARECALINETDRVILIYLDDNKEPMLKYVELGDNIPVMLNINSDNPKLMNESGSNVGFQLSITGSSFDLIRTNYPKIYENLLLHGKVFARMSPEQKQQLIESLQGKGYFVGMCGDGANDCGIYSSFKRNSSYFLITILLLHLLFCFV